MGVEHTRPRALLDTTAAVDCSAVRGKSRRQRVRRVAAGDKGVRCSGGEPDATRIVIEHKGATLSIFRIAKRRWF